MRKRQIGSNQIYVGRLFVIMLILSCLSCSKDQSPEVNSLIVGKWEWIETINAWTGIKYTPDTEGYTRTLIYKNDNTVEAYKNGDLVDIEIYQIRKIVYDPQDPNSETAMVLIINDSESHFTIRDDTLFVSQAHVDGPASRYKRKE